MDVVVRFGGLKELVQGGKYSTQALCPGFVSRRCLLILDKSNSMDVSLPTDTTVGLNNMCRVFCSLQGLKIFVLCADF